jgi:hypothetical protein
VVTSGEDCEVEVGLVQSHDNSKGWLCAESVCEGCLA